MPPAHKLQRQRKLYVATLKFSCNVARASLSWLSVEAMEKKFELQGGEAIVSGKGRAREFSARPLFSRWIN